MKTSRNHNKLFLTTMLLAAMVFIAMSVHAQQRNHRITLVARQIPLKEIFYTIRIQTGLQCFYSNEILNAEEKMDVNFNNTPLETVLKTILRKKEFFWVYREEAIVIIPKTNQGPKGQAISEIQKTADTLAGIVTNMSGRPIAGATIAIKGEERGTTTDSQGKFSLQATRPISGIIVSSIGYKGREITVRNNKTLSVQLETAVSSLDEQVVIAYGVSTRRVLTGSVAKVTAKEIAQQPISNPLQALQGRVSGLQVTQVTGLPGSDYKIELRGRNSIASGNNPLYVVDGIPFSSQPLTWNQEAANEDAVNPYDRRLGFGANISSNPLNVINPSDIESIEILKDADATAIYGSRAANGVVLITTKKGVAGKLKAEVNFYNGWGMVAHMVPFLNTPQYLAMRREALRNDNELVHPEDYDLRVWDTARYTDWQREMIGSTAQIQDAQAAASGGSENVQFRLSGGYRRETTAFPGSFHYAKGSLRNYLAISTPDQRWKTSLITAYVSEKNQLPQTDLSTYTTLPPNMPAMRDANGDLTWGTGVFDNPYAVSMRTYKANTEHYLVGLLSAYEVLPGLEVKVSAGYTRTELKEVQINPKFTFSPEIPDVKGFSFFTNNSVKSWIAEPQINYKLQFGKSQFNVLVGATFQQDIRDQEGFFGSQYTNDAQLEDLMSATYIKPLPGGLHGTYRYNAAFGRINYTLKNRYIINLTGRRDGSSRFGPDAQFANFASAGAAWIFSEEPFVKPAWPLLSFGKLRASYGTTGNDQIPDYEYSASYIATPPYNGVGGLATNRLANPFYGWEKNQKLEAALELGFYKDRIQIRSNYFRNRSSNQLVKQSLSGVTGFTSIRANIPAVVLNEGWELELKTVLLPGRYFSWSSAFNATIVRNKLQDFPGLEGSAYNSYFTEGQPLHQFKGYHYLGVDPATGVYLFEDINGDGKLSSPHDTKYTKTLGPTAYGGWQNSFSWKNWQLDLLFQFVRQNGFNYEFGSATGPGYIGNQPMDVLQHWRKPSDQAPRQQFTQSFITDAGKAFSNYAINSDKAITDASFIRLKNLYLCYRLPEYWMKRCRLSGSRLYIQGQNLFTLTPYKGRDPENAAMYNANGYPPLRVWTTGLQIDF